MYYMKCYMQTAILKPNQRQEAGEVNGQAPKPSETKSQESKVKSKKPEAKNQKPKAKWACKWEILAPKCMQITHSSSNMQHPARKAAPG